VSLPSPEALEQSVQERPQYPQPPSVAPYHPPPDFPPPSTGRAATTDGRAVISLIAAILGILLGVPFGIPGLALGTMAYFLGRLAISRIDGAPETSSGRGLAVAGSVLGVVATAIGAVVSLAWLVLLLVAASTTPTLG
jgi:hypothetical protein